MIMKALNKLFGVVMVAVAAVLMPSCIYVDGKPFGRGSSLIGNGEIESRSIALPDYHRVVAERGVVVELVDTSYHQLTVSADSNVMPYVVVTADGGDLCVTIDKAVRRVGDINVRVKLPKNSKIEHLQASSDAEIEILSPLEGMPKLGINTSSAAEIRGEVNSPEITIAAASASEVDMTLSCDKLTVSASSASEVELRGVATTGEFMTASAADIDSSELQTDYLKVLAASAGEASVFCTRHLQASASSAGVVEYRGECTLEKSVSSGGSVRFDD